VRIEDISTIGELNKYLDVLIKEGRDARDAANTSWDKSKRVFAGEMWQNIKMPGYKSKPSFNHIRHVIERKTAILTDNMPSVRVLTRRDDLMEVASDIQSSIAGNWDEQSIDLRLMRTCAVAQVYGSAPLGTIWNPVLDNGYGDVDMVLYSPESFGFDPYIADVSDLRNGEYLFREYQRPTSELVYRFPECKELIMASAKKSVVEQIADAWTKLFGTSKTTNPIMSAVDRSFIQEIWVRDRRMLINQKDQKPLYNAIGMPILIYPNGWRHILRVNGALILYDFPVRYIDQMPPIDVLTWKLKLDSAYGSGEVDDLNSPQEVYNKMMAAIVDNTLLMTNAIWQGDANALTPEQWQKLSNAPGSFVKQRPGTTLERVTGVPLPPQAFNSLSYSEEVIEKLSGMTDVVLGMKPGRVSSGVGIEALQGAAQAVVRLKARQIEAVLNAIGQKFVARILQYYTSDRIKVTMSREGDPKKYRYIRNKVLATGLSGSELLQNLMFKVLPGSSMSMTNVQKSMIAMQLQQLGILGDEDLLEAVGWEDRKGTIERGKSSRKARLKEQAEMAAYAEKLKGGTSAANQPPALSPGEQPPEAPTENPPAEAPPGKLQRGVPGQRNAGSGIVM